MKALRIAAAVGALAACAAACRDTEEAPSPREAKAEVVAGDYVPSRWVTLPNYLYSHAPRSGRLAVDLYNPGNVSSAVTLRFEAVETRRAVLEPETIVIEAGGHRQVLVGRPPEEQWDLFREEDELQFDIRGDASAPIVAFVGGGFDVGASFGGVALENMPGAATAAPGEEIPSSMPSVEVVSATYGASCGAPNDNVLAIARSHCEGHPLCVLPITTSTFNDPAPGCAKDFRISWRCGSGALRSQRLPAATATRGNVVLPCMHLADATSDPKPLVVSTSDVAAGHLFASKIQLVTRKGIFPGCATGFCPESLLTRGDMAEIIVRALYDNREFAYSSEPAFPTDVPPTHQQFRFVQKLQELGITTGCTATAYCPNDPVTRGQMAVFLTRAMLETDQFPYSPTPLFDDVPPAHLFFKQVQKLRELGITDGCRARTFCVDDATTRGQMAVFVARSFYGAEAD